MTTIQKTEAHITRVLQNGCGFAYCPDIEGDVFLPPSVMSATGAVEGENVNINITPDAREGVTCQYRALSVAKEAPPTPPAAQEVISAVKVVLDYVAQDPRTTAQVAAHIGGNTTAARNILAQMHHKGRIARADMHRRADQERASLTIWCADADMLLPPEIGETQMEEDQ